METYKQILRYQNAGLSQRETAKILSISRNTVAKVIHAAIASDVDWEDIRERTEEEIKEKLFPKVSEKEFYQQPDFEVLAIELRKPSVTKKLLWEEYVKECHVTETIPYQYTQFCALFNRYIEQAKATMYFEHTPGEKGEVDWAGQTYEIFDAETGQAHKVYFFVAALPYSQYSYVEGTADMKQENWINAHVNLFHFLGGSPRMLVCDNLKTAVLKHAKQGDILLNAAYQEMADYYDTAIIPARPRTPKGKPSVEGAVGNVSRQIIAALRHEKFYSLYDLNLRVRELLEKFNEKGFQKRKGSRLEVFLTEEKPYLQALPKERYEYGTWKTARVQYNYHVSVEKMYYSVPFQYIKKDVRIRMTQNHIEIYYQGQRLYTHPRKYGHPGKYVTVEAHMPLNHRQAKEWNRSRFINWAKQIGPHTEKVIRRLLDSYKVEQQAYNGCLAILKLTDKYPDLELEAACKKALTIIHTPTYRNIQRITEMNHKLRQTQDKATPPELSDTPDYLYIRGEDYYKGE